MSDDQQLTHQDWERAKSRADVAAYQCTLLVLAGNFDQARDYAVQSQAFTKEMTRISAALAAQEPS